MKDEIKEILDKLKDSATFPVIDVPTMDGTDSEPMDNNVLLEPNECKILLDYITNLQEIAEDHKNCTRKHWQQKCAEHCANEMIYKSRNEKAIKCIKDKYYKEEYERKGTFANKLMNILQGSDKE